MLSRFVIAFLPRIKHLLFSWLQSPSVVILEPKKIKSVTVSIVSPSICREVIGPDTMILVFWILIFKPVFSLSSFTYIKRRFSSSSLSATRVVPSASVQFSHSVMPDSLRPHESQHPCPSPTPRLHPNQCPLSWWSIQPSHPLSTGFSPALNLFQHQGLFKWVSSSREVAKVLEFQL